MKRVVLLGCTGSIGTSTLKVVEDQPDRLQLVG
ncbi:MAG: 1-deoxy-D-xylulose 5-phosphate reductoisomerase, partial [Verrucomicrobiota bacterium]|jgi:1-deoxy-D-xylulose 5-phosphate reductoisomerase